MPVGALRALIAGLVGFVAALILGRALRATESGNLAAFFSVALGVPLIVAMIFIVAAEALVPTAGPQPVEIVLGARSRARGATRRSAGSWRGRIVPAARGMRLQAAYLPCPPGSSSGRYCRRMSESTSITGRWRITEMDNWDQEAVDLVQPGFIEFDDDGLGSLGFIVVTGELDCRDAERDGEPGIEFSWQGSDEGD
ncbi:MAG TPA: hypothetical protein VLM11_01100, partial [Streptosporangiaceae bacterium]|nr:hypothetical protein [Streptosporangiaceae bacterium]